MSAGIEDLPSLDAHAHIAPDVTPAQVEALRNSHTFAVTRNLDEAKQVTHKSSQRLTWGIGVHPGDRAKASYDERAFAKLLPQFGLIGEIGLDGRAGDLATQIKTLTSILRIADGHPVLLSVHSAGAASHLLEALDSHPHPGTILHWWTDAPELDRALASGAYFSVNAAMRPEILARIPADRILTETDFPARRAGARKPGDTRQIEQQIADLWQTSLSVTRHRLWVNLRRLVMRAEALDRLPEPLADMLLAV